jgi:hypothetical protein
VVEPIEAKTSYKHCIDNIGASISLVYTCICQKLAEHIAHFSQAIVILYIVILYSNVMLHYIPLLLRTANDVEENIYARL